jgi:hypothetical protein
MYIGRQPIIGNFVKLDAITTSATTTFNLTNGGVAYFPQSANNCLVSLNGILQAPTDSYTISGSTIVFSNALTTSDVIDFIIVLGDVLNIGTPSDNTVTAAKIVDGTITPAKLTDLANPFGKELLHVRDEKAAATAGGGFTSGAWQTRTLNTVKTNEISGASLSSNQITLPSGTYHIIAKALAHKVNFNKLKLRNITDSSDIMFGFTGMEHDGADSEGKALLDGRFTISAQKVIELQHRCSATRATDGFGRSESLDSSIEVFADVQIWKVA